MWIRFMGTLESPIKQLVYSFQIDSRNFRQKFKIKEFSLYTWHLGQGYV